MNHRFTLFLSIIIVIGTTLPSFAQTGYFFPKAEKFDDNIPTPEQFLGYEIGARQTRYDRVVAYMEELARRSDRVTIETIGQTYEYRPQVVLTITEPSNHGRLEEVQRDHLQMADPSRPVPATDNLPVLVHLGYNVHGNESSSTEVSMLTAYFYAANQDEETLRYLNEAIIFIDPALNPDGRDRHTNWVSMHQGNPPVSDPADREHNEVWPGGRGNHYWFDLNRDWMPLVHVESRNRMEFFHRWLPNVFIDFHEMGTGSTYFFEPTKPFASENRLVPRSNYEGLNEVMAQYHAAALDELGSLYFTKEQFDNIYPGYGGTYADFQGGLAITFEQASSRGNVQENPWGELTFAFTIRNHLATGLATVKGAVENKEMFFGHKRDFFNSALTDAGRNPVRAYVYGDDYDATKLNIFTEKLLAHKIEVYELERDQEIDGNTFKKGKAFLVPTEQPQYRMVESFFAKMTDFDDSVFYDASTWTLALAFNLKHAEAKNRLGRGERVTEIAPPAHAAPEKSTYAYLLDWSDFNAPGALYSLQKKGVLTQTVFKPFTASTAEGARDYQAGTVSIPVTAQRISSDSLHRIIEEVVKEHGVSISTVSSGLSLKGVDLGSANVKTLTQPKAMILTGQGVSPYEVGEVWFLLDEQLKMPITKVELSSFGGVDLGRYTTIVMVHGQYHSLDKNAVEKLKRWVNEGGTLITLKGASTWAIENELANGEVISAKDTSEITDRVAFADAAATEGAKSVGGSIYEVDLDLTHPLGFGYTDSKLPVYRNSTVFLAPSKNPYSTVAQYTDKPYLSGYVSEANLNRIRNSAALLVHQRGRGNVIMFADNPNFRGTWYGTNRLFLNALFFGSEIRTPGTH